MQGVPWKTLLGFGGAVEAAIELSLAESWSLRIQSVGVYRRYDIDGVLQPHERPSSCERS